LLPVPVPPLPDLCPSLPSRLGYTLGSSAFGPTVVLAFEAEDLERSATLPHRPGDVPPLASAAGYEAVQVVAVRACCSRAGERVRGTSTRLHSPHPSWLR
jgi:hypothetical protein